MTKIILSAIVGETEFKVGQKVAFLIDGDIDSHGEIIRIEYSGHFEDFRRFDFMIQWEDCTNITRTPMSLMGESVVVI